VRAGEKLEATEGDKRVTAPSPSKLVATGKQQRALRMGDCTADEACWWSVPVAWPKAARQITRPASVSMRRRTVDALVLQGVGALLNKITASATQGTTCTSILPVCDAGDERDSVVC
jgi:hypothetical protein